MKQAEIFEFIRQRPRFLAMATALAIAITALPAKAEIVYTSANVTIRNGSLKIDLNHDGITDFSIGSAGYPCPGSPTTAGEVDALPAQGNGIVAKNMFALALPSGVRISSSQPFYYADAFLIDYRYCAWPPGGEYAYGYWLGGVYNHYLGFKFQINGHTHYGWARLSVQIAFRNVPKTTLTGYAYETVAGQAITTGQTTGP